MKKTSAQRGQTISRVTNVENERKEKTEGFKRTGERVKRGVRGAMIRIKSNKAQGISKICVDM